MKYFVDVEQVFSSDKFQKNCIFDVFTCSYSIPRYLWPTQSWGLNMNMSTCWRPKTFEIVRYFCMEQTMWFQGHERPWKKLHPMAQTHKQTHIWTLRLYDWIGPKSWSPSILHIGREKKSLYYKPVINKIAYWFALRLFTICCATKV